MANMFWRDAKQILLLARERVKARTNITFCVGIDFQYCLYAVGVGPQWCVVVTQNPSKCCSPGKLIVDMFIADAYVLNFCTLLI